MSVIYPSYDDFLIARGLGMAARIDSYDYGVWWRDRSSGVYHLCWLGPRARPEGSAPAGELFLRTLRGSSNLKTVELLCRIDPIGDDDPFDANVEGILDGWGEVCGNDGSTDWIRDRVREAIEAGWATFEGLNGQHVILGIDGGDNRVSVSSDGGETWSEVTSPLVAGDPR